MHDHERLKITRQTIRNLELLGMKRGLYVFRFTVCLGNDFSKAVGKSLGLLYDGKAKGTVKPM